MINTYNLKAALLLLLIVAIAPQAMAQKQKALKPATELKQHKRSDTVGIVNGDIITFGDFNHVMSGYLKILTKRSGDNLLTDSLYSQIVDSAWVKMEQDIIIEQEIRKRHLAMTPKEALDSLISDPPMGLKTQFIDSAGVFHVNEYKQAFTDPRNDSIVQPIVMTYQSMLETAKLRKALEVDRSTGAALPYDVWLKRAIGKAKIVDHRLQFGFY